MNDGTEEELDVDVELLNWEEPIFCGLRWGGSGGCSIFVGGVRILLPNETAHQIMWGS
jgi:hypothetical protein